MKDALRAMRHRLATIFEEQPRDAQGSTIAALDGVRACAILMVIVFHINWIDGNYQKLWDWRSNPLASSLAIAGGTGVTLFFVLSGFLLFLPYAKALLFAGRWPRARTFYLRRALRIMPGYYLSLLLLILLSAPSYLQAANLPATGLFLTLFMDSSPQTFRALNGPYWTLATEWQFYLLLPLLALALLLLVRRVPLERRLRALIFALPGLMVCGLCVRWLGAYHQGHPGATFLLPRRALNVLLFFTYGQTGKYTEDFAVGMLAAVLYTCAQRQPAFAQQLRRASLWLWGAGILILVFSAIWHFQANGPTPAWPLLDPLLPYYFWLSEWLLALGYALCILAILYGPSQLRGPFTWQPVRWIGLISYSLYIWHLPLLALLQSRILPLLGSGHPPAYSMQFYLAYALYWLWVPLVLFPFCTLVYIFVEKPGIRLGARWRQAIEERAASGVRAREQGLAHSPAEESTRVSAQENGGHYASIPRNR
ncbi:MAG TPA: acyltransferase [Ktedonobacteraceae bacterium]|jgi:peptidoglycan/LPS O-acetylase OafA/YrhL